MYILHRRHKRIRTLTILVVLAVLAGSAAVFGKGYFSAETNIGPTPAAVVSTVHDTRSASKHINEAAFSFDVPNDWEPVQIPGLSAGTRSWQNTKDNKGVRAITLYLDSVPADFAINRVVAVEVADNRMTVSGDVSDNCTNFTGSGGQGSQASNAGKAPAKWQGVNFICDTGNYVRDVVGTGSAGTLNATKLVGPTTGAHNVFLTYTDNSASPDYGIFTDMLQTFQLK